MKNHQISLLAFVLMLGVSLSSLNAQADRLIEFITDQQDLHVKESCNTSSCFTDIDLEKFLANDVVNEIVRELEKNSEFVKVISEIKMLPETEKNALLRNARNKYLPTWAKNGQINCKGQTDAGQSAQRRISLAVVNLAKRMMKDTNTSND